MEAWRARALQHELPQANCCLLNIMCIYTSLHAQPYTPHMHPAFAGLSVALERLHIKQLCAKGSQHPPDEDVSVVTLQGLRALQVIRHLHLEHLHT